MQRKPLWHWERLEELQHQHSPVRGSQATFPMPPSTYLVLIWHLVGRGVLLHDIRSQDLEAPSELGEEQAIRIPWGHTDITGGCTSLEARGSHQTLGREQAVRG